MRRKQIPNFRREKPRGKELKKQEKYVRVTIPYTTGAKEVTIEFIINKLLSKIDLFIFKRKMNYQDIYYRCAILSSEIARRKGFSDISPTGRWLIKTNITRFEKSYSICADQCAYRARKLGFSDLDIWGEDLKPKVKTIKGSKNSKYNLRLLSGCDILPLRHHSPTVGRKGNSANCGSYSITSRRKRIMEKNETGKEIRKVLSGRKLSY